MIDFSEFEKKTKGGYGWEVIEPEDGLIRVIDPDGDKLYLLVDETGEVTSWINGDTVSLVKDCALVLREEEWRAGWRPEEGIEYLTYSRGGVCTIVWYSDKYDLNVAALGNCYPDTPRGKLLVEARAKYEPLIGEIAGMDDPEHWFSYLRSLGPGNTVWEDVIDVAFGKGVLHAASLRAAIRWLDSGYRLTIEEAES